jgi:putative protease
LRTAIEAGADSVYFGLKHFTARAKVGFAVDELPEVVRTLHSRGVRGYLTFNTLVFEHELDEAAKTIAAVVNSGVDALIVQDVGILRLARQIAPHMELHASTQMSITDAEGVRFAQSLGVDRVTLARELSLEEIRKIYDQTGCELEMFVHGALCVAYSGQCFSSEAWGGRSANRGQCAQACRLPYDLMVDGEHEPLADARYLLSPGDLYTLHQVPEIIRAGVAALKIEGRYKDSDYVAMTTQAYRKAVDEAWAGRVPQIRREDELRLEQVYSRGLGAHFVTGTNHQAVVNGRAPRHRGVLIGRVTEVGPDAVLIAASEAHSVLPLKPGDGVVFDAADWRSPGEPEEGGRIYEIAARRDRSLELRFGNGAVHFDRIRAGDLVWRTHDPSLAAIVRPFIEAAVPVRRQPVSVQVTAKESAPLVSEWWLANRPELSVTVTSGAPLGAARDRVLSQETLHDQFGRLGNTAYELAEITLETEGAPFAPASLLNQVRREAVEKLQTLQTAQPAREVRTPEQPHYAPAQLNSGTPQLHLLVRTPEQLAAALAIHPASITLDYLDLYGLRPSIEQVKASGVTARVASPRVLKPGEARIVNFLESLGCRIVVRSSGILNVLQNKEHPELIGDFSLNAANSVAAHEYLERGLSRITPTHDLNAAQIADLARLAGPDKLEVVAYQHLPVFHTEHCVFCRFMSTGTSYKDCGRPCEKHTVALRDQSGRSHPVMADVGCRNTVFGAEAQEASSHLDSWLAAGIRHFRLEFVHETAAQVRQVAKAFEGALAGHMNSAQLNRELKAVAPGGTTQGSLLVRIDYLELPVLAVADSPRDPAANTSPDTAALTVWPKDRGTRTRPSRSNGKPAPSALAECSAAPTRHAADWHARSTRRPSWHGSVSLRARTARSTPEYTARSGRDTGHSPLP